MAVVECPVCGQTVENVSGSCPFCGSLFDVKKPVSNVPQDVVADSGVTESVPEETEQEQPYTQPVQQNFTADKSAKKLAIASLALSVVGFLFLLVAILTHLSAWMRYLLMLCPMAAFVLGIIGLVKYNGNKKNGIDEKNVMIFSIVGLVLGAVSLIVMGV